MYVAEKYTMQSDAMDFFHRLVCIKNDATITT